MSPEKMFSRNWNAIATSGVLKRPCTCPNGFGNAPIAPDLYHMRVETLLHASDTAMTELKNAIRRIHQAPPQNRSESTSPGSVDEDGSFEMSSMPQPTTTPQLTMIRKRPRITIDHITPLGTFRFGSAVSSASGAAPSQPV